MIDDMLDVVISNESLVYSIINKYKKYFDVDDLLQVGRMALINAYKNYNNKIDTKFSTYAYFYILGEVNKFIRESSFFKISKNYASLNKKVNKARELLSLKYNRNVSNSEIAKFLEIDEGLIDDVVIATSFVTSIDNGNDDFLALSDIYGYNENAYNSEILDLKNEINKLDDFSKKIINNRYIQGNTQVETSKNLGVTQVMISRKEKEILEKLRVRLK